MNDDDVHDVDGDDDEDDDCYGEKFLWLGVPQQTARLQKSIFPNMQ